MTNPDFFTDPTIRTPEEQVRENERLRKIDKTQIEKAQEILAEEIPPEEFEQNRTELITALTDLAGETVEQLTTEYDPNFEDAQNITVRKISTKPSRLPFVKRMVPVIEKEDIAAWYIFSSLDAVVYGPFLGRDKVLYGWHSEKNKYTSQTTYILKEIDLSSLSAQDLIELDKGVKDIITRHKLLKDIESF